MSNHQMPTEGPISLNDVNILYPDSGSGDEINMNGEIFRDLIEEGFDARSPGSRMSLSEAYGKAFSRKRTTEWVSAYTYTAYSSEPTRWSSRYDTITTRWDTTWTSKNSEGKTKTLTTNTSRTEGRYRTVSRNTLKPYTATGVADVSRETEWFL